VRLTKKQLKRHRGATIIPVNGRLYAPRCIKKLLGCISMRARKIKDLTGQRFGKLTALQFMGQKQGSAIWQCRCDCGKICVRNRVHFYNAKIPSCGCAAMQAGVKKREKVLPDNVNVGKVAPPPPPEFDTRDRWQKRRSMAAAYRRRIGMEGVGKQDAEKYSAAKAGGHGMEWHEGV